MSILDALNPTLHIQTGDISRLPWIIDTAEIAEVSERVQEAISICKAEWDSWEHSYEFSSHPLISGDNKIEEAYRKWKVCCESWFERIKIIEETNNEYFIRLYGLEDVLNKTVMDSDISIRKSNLHKDICSLVSYAVGCMFGRYSLDVEGLAYAGGDWKEAYATKYKTFMPDADAIIPITDEEYFKDDIVARFVDFIRIVYGEETLEENLKFIADALGNKGDTPRAVIRNYFLNDFYKDHCNTYSVTGSGKRPIYWLFDSGKQNGFKALIYIHRYTPDTVGLIRSVYLHNAQAAIQNSLQNSEYIISTTTSATERARETRKKDKYVKQLNELRPYYQALSHIALQRIPMDLDDGVKKNYQLFQGVEVSTEGKKKQTIDLLAKI